MMSKKVVEKKAVAPRKNTCVAMCGSYSIVVFADGVLIVVVDDMDLMVVLAANTVVKTLSTPNAETPILITPASATSGARAMIVACADIVVAALADRLAVPLTAPRAATAIADRAIRPAVLVIAPLTLTPIAACAARPVAPVMTPRAAMRDPAMADREAVKDAEA